MFFKNVIIRLIVINWKKSLDNTSDAPLVHFLSVIAGIKERLIDTIDGVLTAERAIRCDQLFVASTELMHRPQRITARQHSVAQRLEPRAQFRRKEGFYLRKKADKFFSIDAHTWNTD